MDTIVDRFNKIKLNIASAKPSKQVNIIAISKTFKIDHINPLIKYGHQHFGENKVQEAVAKWSPVLKDNKNIKLHMVGKLQSNKVKDAINLFDYIHSLDNQKLAEKISIQQDKVKFRPKIFIQVNIGNEPQKSGVNKGDLESFYKKCVEKYNLEIIGLMCIPPEGEDPKIYFKNMLSLNKSLGLNELSMGMSNDYISAVDNGATFIRVGSKIFGERFK